jgi:two-component system chemotaxis response regulator CheV
LNRKHDLAGQNRFEMLVFTIGSSRFGINVFKVREIIELQEISFVPGSHENIMGIITIRGNIMPVIHMSQVLGIDSSNDKTGKFIVTEYNRTVQAIKIDDVINIENISWEDVNEPPGVGNKGSYLTSVVKIDDKLIQVLDVERILSEINDDENEDDEKENVNVNRLDTISGQGKRVFLVDDSKVAQKQLSKALSGLGFTIDCKNNGKEALDHLIELSERTNINDYYDVMITDIEMPKMDGYTLVAELRNRGFNDFKIIMHTSMSGVFNKAMVDRVGANDFIPKFNEKEIHEAVFRLISGNRDRIAA